MKFNQKHYLTIWMEGTSVFMIDQNDLPFHFRIHEAKTYQETCHAIITMITRGAGAIGAAAGFAMAQAFLEGAAVYAVPGNKLLSGVGESDKSIGNLKQFVSKARKEIESTRPTARNLFYAAGKVYEAGMISVKKAVSVAQELANDNINEALQIGEAGNQLIKEGCRILTHCNAGWLGFVDWGSALSPIYVAHHQGKNIFVFADETRPRSQGARLTAWELFNEGVPHCIVPDNAGAHLMSKGMIDMVIVGADRIASNGDTANKIGTFEKAIIAREFGIPFYVAAPASTFDFGLPDGSLIPIEERSAGEVFYQSGPDNEGSIQRIRITSPGSAAINPAFDVTPVKYITAFITEKGIIEPKAEELQKLRS